MLSDLAFGLAEHGIDVTVITSRLRYSGSDALLPARETIRGVETIRIRTSNFGRGGLLFRACDYLTFYLSAIFALLRTLRGGDVLIAMTDPPMLSVIAVPIARLRGARAINWLQDLFPEVAVALGVFGKHGKAMLAPLRWLRDASLRRAEMNVVIGERMAGRLFERRVPRARVRVVPNWADCNSVRPIAGRNALREDWELTDHFVVGYSGNLGRAHDVTTLLDAAALFERRRAAANDQAIKWLFVGGGHLFLKAAQEVVSRNLRSVSFQPYQAREHLSHSLCAADVHLVVLRPELEGLIVPSKFYGVSAAGRATIFIGAADGEIARLIDRHGCGLHVDSGDAEALAEAIQRLMRDNEETKKMGARARSACEAYYDKTRAIRSWVLLLGGELGGDSQHREMDDAGGEPGAYSPDERHVEIQTAES